MQHPNNIQATPMQHLRQRMLKLETNQ